MRIRLELGKGLDYLNSLFVDGEIWVMAMVPAKFRGANSVMVRVGVNVSFLKSPSIYRGIKSSLLNVPEKNLWGEDTKCTSFKSIGKLLFFVSRK